MAMERVLLEEMLMAEEEAVLLADMELDGDILSFMEERARDRRRPTRVEDYVDHTIPLYNAQEFKSHFRMERGSFEVSILRVK